MKTFARCLIKTTVMRWILGLALALLAGLISIYTVTDGFTVVTAEAARRRDVERDPPVLLGARVVNEADNEVSLRHALHGDGRVAIVNFFYTRCVSLCLAQGYVTQRLQTAIAAQGLQDDIRLISISFDQRDRAVELNRYASTMRAQPEIWEFWALQIPGQRDALLRQFGITVVPAPYGDYEHNAALHVVTPDGRLAGIFDIEQPGLAFGLATVLSSAGQ